MIPECNSCAKCCYNCIVPLAIGIDENKVNDIFINKEVPQKLKTTYFGFIKLRETGSCMCLDEETKLCTIHNNKPEMCITFERGSDFCLAFIEKNSQVI